MPTKIIREHEKTASGVNILAKKDMDDGWSIVLCDVVATSLHPFVTWIMSPERNTYTGHYHSNLIDAVEDFKRRS